MDTLEKNIRKAQITIKGEPYPLAGRFEEVGRHALQKIALKGAISGEWQILLIDPPTLASLTDAEINTLKDQYARQIPGAVFLALELKLATLEQLGIRPKLNKK